MNRIEWNWASLKEVPVYKKSAGVCSIEESGDSWAHGSSLHIVSTLPPALAQACAEAGYLSCLKGLREVSQFPEKAPAKASLLKEPTAS